MRTKGYKYSAETRARMSASAVLRVNRSEMSARLAEANAKRVWTPEMRAKVGAAQRGNKSRVGLTHTAETLAKISAANSGKVASAETRERLSRVHAGKALSFEHRAKIGAANAGLVRTSEQRLAMSEARRQEWADGRAALRPTRRYTSLAQALHAHLSDKGFTLEPEVRFGRFTVDLYDREHHVAYEADGSYWHDRKEARDPGSSARRDEYLVRFFNLKVFHFTDKEISALTGWPKKKQEIAS